MTAWVNLERSAPISRHITSVCAEAKDSTYIRDVDLKAWAELPGTHLFYYLHFNQIHLRSGERVNFVIFTKFYM